MNNSEILNKNLSPISNSCKIWNEFLNLSNCVNLYWSKNNILLNHGFKSDEFLYISTSRTANEELYNAMQNLNTYYTTDLWNFKIVDICELKFEREEKYFWKKVADALYKDNNEELDYLREEYQNQDNKNNTESSVSKYLPSPTFDEIVDRLNKTEISKLLIGQHFITKVELDNTDITDGIKNRVYILFSFVDDSYFNNLFINQLRLNCQVI